MLDAKLVADFLDWSANVRGNSPDWVRKQQRFLSWWCKQLGGRDLRRITLGDHVAPALEGVTSRKHRIEVLKALFRWLCAERHLLTAAEDTTYGALAVPQGRAEQWVHLKPIPREHHEKVLKSVIGINRDRLLVLAGTGWTSPSSLAAAGVVAALPSTASHEHGASAALVCPRRKSGEAQRTAVSAEIAAAAKRVRKQGSFSLPKFEAGVRATCDVAGVERFSPGRYRHSVATWAVEAGSDPAAVAAFLVLNSPATTKRFYATLAVVPKAPTLAVSAPAPGWFNRIASDHRAVVLRGRVRGRPVLLAHFVRVVLRSSRRTLRTGLDR